MKKRDLETEIQNLVEKFRLRAKRGSDDKRHDRVRRDEAKAMLKAEQRFGLTELKIAALFQRDERTVAGKLQQARQEPEKPEKLERAVEACLDIVPYASFVSEPNEGPTGRYVRAEVWNRGERTARTCRGYLQLRSLTNASRRQTESMLHWWGTPFRGVEIPHPVDIPPGHCHLLDIAFSLPRSGFQQQVEGVTTSGQVSVITVTFDAYAPGDSNSAFEGCLIATNLALDRPDPQTSFHLAPGTHEVEVSVGCDNGTGDRKFIQLMSPHAWKDLDCRP